MKGKTFGLVIVVAVLLGGAAYYYGWFDKFKTNGLGQEVDVAVYIVESMQTQQQRIDQLFSDPVVLKTRDAQESEDEYKRFQALMRSKALTEKKVTLKKTKSQRKVQDPFPHYQIRYRISFEFDNLSLARELVDLIFLENSYPLQVGDFKLERIDAEEQVWRFVVPVIYFSVNKLGRDRKPKSYVVLLEDPNGKVGAVAVSNKHGSRVLDKKGYGIGLEDTGEAPPEPFEVSAEEIAKTFKKTELLKADLPVSFTLYFTPNTVKLSIGSKSKVPDILAAVAGRMIPKISISGHSDRAGNKSYNERLALNRAKAVEKVLIIAGIEPEIIAQVNSHGENNPLIRTADGVSEPKNRRVVVTVY